MSNLIFDFDGTLADTFPLVVEVAYDITRARRLPAPKIEELRKVPLVQAVRQLGGKPWDIPFLILLTRRALYARIDEVKAFRGLVAAVEQLHAQDHRLFVLTSNRTRNAQAFLEKRDLAGYFDGLYHCNMFRKGSAIKRILKQERLAAEHTYYIGNEAADIDAARGAGVRAIAVTWSGQDEQVLSRALPFAIARQPDELVSVITEQA
jgi:phosphoglycolate phosphatase